MADGTMYSRQPGGGMLAHRRGQRARPAVADRPGGGDHVGGQPPGRPAASSRAVTTACATPGARASTASISPGSTRNPRILT